MKNDMASGFGHKDLTLSYQHHKKHGGMVQKNDLQVAVGEAVGTFFLSLIIASTKVNPAAGML